MYNTCRHRIDPKNKEEGDGDDGEKREREKADLNVGTKLFRILRSSFCRV